MYYYICLLCTLYTNMHIENFAEPTLYALKQHKLVLYLPHALFSHSWTINHGPGPVLEGVLPPLAVRPGYSTEISFWKCVFLLCLTHTPMKINCAFSKNNLQYPASIWWNTWTAWGATNVHGTKNMKKDRLLKLLIKFSSGWQACKTKVKSPGTHQRKANNMSCMWCNMPKPGVPRPYWHLS